MNYALRRCGEEMKAELDKWGIEIASDAIIYNGTAKVIRPYTTSREIKRELNYLIRQAKAAAQAKIDEKQAKLL